MVAEIITNLILKFLAWWYEGWKARNRKPVQPTQYQRTVQADVCEGCGWLGPEHEYWCSFAPGVWDSEPDRPTVWVGGEPDHPRSEWVLPTGLTEEELEDWIHAQESRS